MKNIIKCDSAPAALGPYSHACEANGFIFTSGQLGIDPQDWRKCNSCKMR